MPTTITKFARSGPIGIRSPAGTATVLVPLDGSERALAALPPARLIAEIAGDSLHLAHIAEGPIAAREFPGRLGLSPEIVRGSVIDLAAGDIGMEIVRLCEDLSSRYVVMCTHTGHPGIAGALGHVAQDVVSNSLCPVILVPPAQGQAAYAIRRVLLPHDGTPTTTAAAAPAIELAHAVGAELVVLHVAGAHASPPVEPGSMTMPRYVDQSHYEWPAWAREFLDRVHCPPEVLSRMRMVSALETTGTQIAEFAADNAVDLIVLDWHGSWEADHAEIAKCVLRDAGCPVMMIRVGG